jgi:hypothetical protein
LYQHRLSASWTGSPCFHHCQWHFHGAFNLFEAGVL